MAAEYFKENDLECYYKIDGGKRVDVMLSPKTETYRIQHFVFKIMKPINRKTVTTITAREFQEAYLRAKTALDDIVSAG